MEYIRFMVKNTGVEKTRKEVGHGGDYSMCSVSDSYGTKNRKSITEDGIMSNKGLVDDEGAQCGDITTKKVKRELKPRHMSMISLGGTIGTGLFVGISRPLAIAGPVGCLLGYLFMASIGFFVTQSLGEMATFIPITSSFTTFTQRFLSPALSAANGYLYWFSWCVTFAMELTVMGQLIRYWTDKLPLTVWIVFFWVLITCANMFPVKYYGEVEFWVSSLKVISILAFILYAFVMVCGASSNGAIGFRYWRNPGSFGTGVTAMTDNLSFARFLGFVSSLINAAFTYQGTELVGVTAGESKNPRKTIPKAINQVFFRILFFYILSLLFVGLLVPYNDPALTSTSGSDLDLSTSPFVISIRNAGTEKLADVFNAIILVTVISAANSNIYIGSRVLYGLAENNIAHKIFTRTTRSGVPYMTVLATSVFGCLSFLNVSTSSKKAFSWLLSITAVAGFFAWLLISVSHIRFMQVLKDRSLSRDDLPFKAKFMPYGAYYAASMIILIIIIQGYESFGPKFDSVGFLTSYISVFFFIAIWIFFQLKFKTRIFLTKNDVDIDSDRHEIDAMVWVQDLDESSNKIWKKLWKLIT